MNEYVFILFVPVILYPNLIIVADGHKADLYILLINVKELVSPKIRPGPEKPGLMSLKCGPTRPNTNICRWCKSLKSGPTGGGAFEVHNNCD